MARTKSAKAWREAIRKNCKDVGTYRPAFEPVISTLASILVNRDKAIQLFELSGGKVVVSHTNRNGATNLEQNPALRLANDLNRDALSYWRDLGLTPAGLKKINEEALKGKKRSAFEEALLSISADGDE